MNGLFPVRCERRDRNFRVAFVRASATPAKSCLPRARRRRAAVVNELLPPPPHPLLHPRRRPRFRLRAAPPRRILDTRSGPICNTRHWGVVRIGRRALALAQKGYLVYAGVRSPTFSSEFSKLNARLRPIVIDVAKPEQIEAAVTALSGEFADQKPWRRVSLVGIVNNAGTTLKRPLETVPLEDVQSLWDVNVMGALRVSQAFAPMLRASKGRIVNVGSVQGCVTLPMWGPYALTKYAVEALSDGLRQELEPFGISVSLVSPGYVNTELRGKGVPSNKSLTTTERDQYYSRFAAMWKKDAELVKLSPPCCSETDAAIVHAMTDPFPRTRYYPFTANVKFGPLFPAWLASMLLRATSVHPLLDRLKDKVIWVTGS